METGKSYITLLRLVPLLRREREENRERKRERAKGSERERKMGRGELNGPGRSECRRVNVSISLECSRTWITILEHHRSRDLFLMCPVATRMMECLLL